MLLFKVLSRALLVVMLFVASTSVGFAQEEDEEAKLTLTALEPGVSVQDSFSGDLTARLYRFTASEGDVVSISMTQISSALDPYLVLLGPRGEVIANDDDSGETPLSSFIAEAVIPEDGSYWVLASSFTHLRTSTEIPEGEALEYELSATGFSNDEAIEVIYYAGTLVADEAFLGEVTEAEDVFYLVFEATEGSTVDITLESETLDPILYLFDGNGNRLAVNDDGEGLGLNSAITGVSLPADGLYLVFAAGASFYSADSINTGEFTALLTVTE